MKKEVMRLRNILALTALGICLLASCYEDKGNYDYKTLNEIEIEVPLEGSYFVLGDTIKVKPVMKFGLGSESPGLSYKWTYGNKPISYTKDLEWIADTVASNCNLRLEVLDPTTGVTYFGSNLVSINTAYVGEGWVILSEKDQISTLAYLRKYIENDTLKCRVTKDIYQLINKESLGTQPTAISLHCVNRFDSEDKVSWIWMAQKGGAGCVDISGSTYRSEGYLENMFLSGSYPEGFKPCYVVDLRYLTLAIGEDGCAYTRVKEDDLLFNSGYFLDRPLSFEDKEVDASQLVLAPFAEHGGILLFDKNSSRYLHLCDAKDQYISFPSGNLVINAVYSGKILSPTIYDKAYSKVPGFPRLNDMNGYKVHYVGSYKTNSWGNMGYISVVEKDSRFYIQNFTVNDFDIYDPDLIGATPVSWEEIPLEGLINGASSNVFSLCHYQSNAPYLLLSAGNALYLYYFNGEVGSKLVKYDEYDSPVTSLDTNNYLCRYVAVGLENGEFHVLSLGKSVVEEVLKAGDSKDKRLIKETGFGKILQVLYKNDPQSTDWGWM